MSEAPSGHWFNRTVIGAGLTSLLSDVAYEMATSVLAGFFVLLHIPQSFLGLVEGTGDALANFVKLGVGYYSDRIGKRKFLVVAGYSLTGVSLSLFAFAFGWPLILLGKSLAWIGKGLRGPLRDAILADSVSPNALGRAFGFHRAGDTIGAILGPLLGATLLWFLPLDILDVSAAPHRVVFLVTLIPGIGAALAFALLVREQRFTPKPGLRFRESLAELPTSFKRYLVAVGLFGMGDFAPSLLILAGTMLLAPTIGLENAIVLGPILYATRNTCQAIMSFRLALSDRLGRRGLLVLGYLIGVAVMLGFAAWFPCHTARLASLCHAALRGRGIYTRFRRH